MRAARSCLAGTPTPAPADASILSVTQFVAAPAVCESAPSGRPKFFCASETSRRAIKSVRHRLQEDPSAPRLPGSLAPTPPLGPTSPPLARDLPAPSRPKTGQVRCRPKLRPAADCALIQPQA